MALCKLCDTNPTAPNGLCEPCMAKLGIIEMPPPRRRAAPCVKCNSLRFVRVIPREHTVRAMQDAIAPEIAPMKCGYVEWYVEWYVEDPTEIPIGPEFMSDIVDYTPDKPYR